MENLAAVGKPAKINKFLPERSERGVTAGAIIRGSILGFFTGLIPGTNSAVPALLFYAIEKNHPNIRKNLERTLWKAWQALKQPTMPTVAVR